MVCPVRKETINEFEKIGAVAVLKRQTEEFPECYGDECPYYSEYAMGNCRVIHRELDEE